MKSQITDFVFGAKCSWASRMLPKASMPRPLPALQRKSRLLVVSELKRVEPLIDIRKLVQSEEDVTEIDEVQARGCFEFLRRRLPTERQGERLLGRFRPRREGYGAVADEGVVQ